VLDGKPLIGYGLRWLIGPRVRQARKGGCTQEGEFAFSSAAPKAKVGFGLEPEWCACSSGTEP
jgi:hypothetical protein